MNEWLNAEAQAERAQRFYEAGQWHKALDALTRALEVNPSQSDWHFGLGLTLEALGRHGEAAEAFERVLELRGDDVETMLDLASNLTHDDRPQEALSVLERVNEIDPDCEQGYCLRIEAYAALEDHDNAEQMFYMARQIVDECPACYDYVARSLTARGDWYRAIWCWHQTARLDPKYPGVYANLAKTHWRRGRYLRAQRLYVRQLRHDPGDIQTLLDWGRMLIEMGQVAQAGEKFRRVLELDTQVAEARLHLGELDLRSGRLDGALTQFNAAHRLAPELPGIDLGLAMIAHQQSRNGKALALLRRELTHERHNSEQSLRIARLLVDLHQPNRATQVLTELINDGLEPPRGREHLVNALLCRGVAHTATGRAQRSVADYRRAVQLAPNCVAAMLRLAELYLSQGRLKRSAYWLRRARRVMPADTRLRQLRKRLILASVAAIGKRIASPLRLGPRRSPK